MKTKEYEKKMRRLIIDADGFHQNSIPCKIISGIGFSGENKSDTALGLDASQDTIPSIKSNSSP